MITFCEASINIPVQSDVAEGQHCYLCNCNYKLWEYQEQVTVVPRSNAAFCLILEGHFFAATLEHHHNTNVGVNAGSQQTQASATRNLP